MYSLAHNAGRWTDGQEKMMSRLDEAKPDANGFYNVEISIDGQWITLVKLSRKNVEKLCDYAIQHLGEDDE